MPFVSLPCRSTSDVALSSKISDFIERNYGSSILGDVLPAVEKLDGLRSNTIQRLRDKTLTAAQQVATYHDTLFLLESRVSMTETDARIDFKWMDLTGKWKKVCSSRFERANLIFCYAAMHSQIAESSDLKDPTGLKQAVISLKLAAGAFEYLMSNSSMFGSSGDNLVDVLNTYSVVMLAQAQECVFLKAEQGNMPSNLIAKLASRTHELYEDGVKGCSVSSVKPHIPKDWSSNLSMKAGLYAALAQYYQAKACNDSRAYGESVARLSLAYDMLKPLSRSSGFPRSGFLEQVKRERDVAIKDNDFIYHDRVPSAKDLSPVPTESAIGKTELPMPLLKGEVKDIFTALVPLEFISIKEQASIILRSLIGCERNRLREATDSINAIMISLDLPAAIQLTANEQTHSALFEKVAKIREQGGVEQLRVHTFSLPGSSTRNREIILHQKSTLDDEEKTDDNLRQQFGDKWTRQPSSKLNAQWRQEITKLLDFLDKAAQTDKLLENRFKQDEANFELLSKSDEEILAAIKGGQDSCGSPTRNENAREALARTCSQIESLKADRTSLEDQLDAMHLSEACVNKMLAMYNTGHRITEEEMKNIINEELEGVRECVRTSETQQKELLVDLQKNAEAYFGKRNSTSESSLSTRLNAAVDAFFALDNDVKQGMKFYADLTERCLKMQQKIDDFCLARTTEKTECLADLTASLGRVNISQGSSPAPTAATTTTENAPARPPPTYAHSTPPAANPTYGGATAPPPYIPAVAPGAPGYGWTMAYGGMAPQYPPYGAPMASYSPYGIPMYGMYPAYASTGTGQMPQMPPSSMMPPPNNQPPPPNSRQ